VTELDRLYPSKTVPCSFCGKPVETRQRAAGTRPVFCKGGKCYAAKRRVEYAQNEDLRVRRAKSNHESNNAYVVLHDPGDDPLAKGMTISATEYHYMLSLHTFTPGTQLRKVNTGKVVTV